MKKITWRKLTILKVSGVSPVEVGAVIAPQTQAGGQEISRIYKAKDDSVLIQLRDTDNDAEVALSLLKAEFGDHRITQVCEV